MALKKFVFNVTSKDKYSRTGLIETKSGNIRTPAFMPVGTQATVKAVKIEDIYKTGTDIILSNIILPEDLFIVSLEKIVVFLFGNNIFTSSDIFSTPGPLNTKSQILPFLHFLPKFVEYPQ